VPTMKGHKRQRPELGPNAWELIVDVGRDPITGRRRQRSRVFRGTSKAADTAMAQLVAEATTERRGPGTDAPLSEIVQAWLDLVEADLSPTTLIGYRRVLRNQIAPGIGQRPVNEITTPDLDRFYRQLLTTLSPASVRQVHAVLRRALRQAVRWGWLPTNPAIDATPPRLKPSKVTAPEAAQVAALLAAADEKDPALGVMLRFSAVTGARRGEVIGLRWSRLDLDAGQVLIDTTVVEDGNKQTVEKDTKTHQARRVALDPATVRTLRGHLVNAKAYALEVGVKRARDPYVFTDDPTGATPMRPDVYTGRFRRLAREHAPGTRLHDLRHFAATQLLAAGVDVKTVSGRLGHGSAAMTLDVYGHNLAAVDQGAADTLGAILDG